MVNWLFDEIVRFFFDIFFHLHFQQFRTRFLNAHKIPELHTYYCLVVNTKASMKLRLSIHFKVYFIVLYIFSLCSSMYLKGWSRNVIWCMKITFNAVKWKIQDMKLKCNIFSLKHLLWAFFSSIHFNCRKSFYY